MKPLGGAPLPNLCLDGSAPGACSGTSASGTSFVLGWQQEGIVQSGPAMGTQQFYVMCDAFNNCSAPFPVVMDSCDDLFLDANDSPLQVVQGGIGQANVIMVGPWIANDHGVNASAAVLSDNLPAGSSISLSAGTAIGGQGVVQIDVATPLSTPVGAYQATIRVTDAVSGISHTAVIPIQVIACAPRPAAEVCASSSAPTCGPHSLGCGLTTDCGECASGSTCTSSGVCCPNGSYYSTNYGTCLPTTCPPGTEFCDATGTCLTPAVCSRHTRCTGTTCM